MSVRTGGRAGQNHNHNQSQNDDFDEIPDVTTPPERPDPAPRVVAVFRRADDTICHTRCGRQLALQGVRGLLEADFYCYTCLTHVSLPVSLLEELPITV
jgi:hypothetical protein